MGKTVINKNLWLVFMLALLGTLLLVNAAWASPVININDVDEDILQGQPTEFSVEVDNTVSDSVYGNYTLKVTLSCPSGEVTSFQYDENGDWQDIDLSADSVTGELIGDVSQVPGGEKKTFNFKMAFNTEQEETIVVKFKLIDTWNGSTVAYNSLIFEVKHEYLDVDISNDSTMVNIPVSISVTRMVYDAGQGFIEAPFREPDADDSEIMFNVYDVNNSGIWNGEFLDKPVNGQVIGNQYASITPDVDQAEIVVWYRPTSIMQSAGSDNRKITIEYYDNGILMLKGSAELAVQPAHPNKVRVDIGDDGDYTPNFAKAGTRVPVRVFAADQYGNPIKLDVPKTVTLESTSESGKFYDANNNEITGITLENLGVIVYYEDTKASAQPNDHQGNYIISARCDSMDEGSDEINIQPAEPYGFSVVTDMQADNGVLQAQAGVTYDFEVRVADEFGNTVVLSNDLTANVSTGPAGDTNSKQITWYTSGESSFGYFYEGDYNDCHWSDCDLQESHFHDYDKGLIITDKCPVCGGEFSHYCYGNGFDGYFYYYVPGCPYCGSHEDHYHDFTTGDIYYSSYCPECGSAYSHNHGNWAIAHYAWKYDTAQTVEFKIEAPGLQTEIIPVNVSDSMQFRFDLLEEWAVKPGDLLPFRVVLVGVDGKDIAAVSPINVVLTANNVQTQEPWTIYLDQEKTITPDNNTITVEQGASASDILYLQVPDVLDIKLEIELRAKSADGLNIPEYSETLDFQRKPFYSKTLYPGWNTLSVPVKLLPGQDTLADIINVDDVEIAFSYDAVNGWSQITDESASMNPMQAILIKVKDKTKAVFYSDTERSLPASYALKTGWNLIGPNAGEPKTAQSILFEVLDQAAKVISPAYHQSDWSMTPAVDQPEEDFDDRYDDSYGWMYPTCGYWVYMTDTGEIHGMQVTPVDNWDYWLINNGNCDDGQDCDAAVGGGSII